MSAISRPWRAPGGRVCRLVAALWMLAVMWAPAHAQAGIDEAKVLQQIIDGRYDQLAALEPAAKAGDHAAQYWWGLLLQGCTFGGCREEEGRSFLVDAASAGHDRARWTLFAQTPAGKDMADLVWLIGQPRNGLERTAWAMATLTSFNNPDKAEWDKANEALKTVVVQEPTMFSLMAADTITRRTPIEVLRAIVAAGYPNGAIATESLRRRLLLAERARFPQQLTQALEGDRVVAVMLCETVALVEGKTVIPDELLPLCLAELRAGQLNLAPTLLAHYMELGQLQQAAPFAKLCLQLPINCGGILGDYLAATLNDKQAWREWDAALAIRHGMPPSEVKASEALTRRGFSMLVALKEASRACLLRRYQPGTKDFEPSATCLWGKPLGLAVAA